jgi:hypothetical protein
MNWKNIDLNSNWETAQNMLDPYNTDTLLLEVACNLPVINPETVKAQALLSLKSKYDTAVEILLANLDNITAHALKERSK